MIEALSDWMDYKLSEGGILGDSILVCVSGGRDFDDTILLARVLGLLDQKVSIREIWHGDARGADRMAGRWARYIGHTVRAFPAPWKRHKNAAGPIRNQQMVDAGPDLIVAMPGGDGTFDMIRRSREAGIPVLDVEEFLLSIP